jgi:thiamine kinase-like enzyme
VFDKPYLLRIITRTDAISDPTHQINCLKAPVEAALAPNLLYAGVEDRILITDFIDAKPFPLSEARLKMAALLSRLHALPPFPFRMNYIERMDSFVRKFQEMKVLPESMTSEVFSQYARILAVYPNSKEEWVSCHNDCKPENILYDGQRPWLVDWEAAFPNDRYADLAVVGNFVVRNDEEEKEYLSAYFGNEPDKIQCARFFLMTQLMHVYYFIFFMMIVHNAGTPIDPNESKPDFRDFHNRIWEGEISLKGDEARIQYAWTHRQQFLDNLQLKRIEESLELFR